MPDKHRQPENRPADVKAPDEKPQPSAEGQVADAKLREAFYDELLKAYGASDRDRAA